MQQGEQKLGVAGAGVEDEGWHDGVGGRQRGGDQGYGRSQGLEGGKQKTHSAGPLLGAGPEVERGVGREPEGDAVGKQKTSPGGSTPGSWTGRSVGQRTPER